MKRVIGQTSESSHGEDGACQRSIVKRPSIFAALFGLGLTAVGALAACGGGSTSTTPIAAPTAATLASATNTQCVTPSTAVQSLTLPATGGVTATISFGAYAAAATGCDTVVISTGADVVTTLSAVRSAQSSVHAANVNGTTPLLTISVGEAFGSNGGPVSAFGYQTIITGMQLTVSSNLNFPDGTYYATVTASGQTFVIPFTAKGGVLTVAGGGGLPVTILAESSALISLYPQGVTPPASTPSPSPSPSPTSSASATASPSAQPTSLATCPAGETACYGTSAPPPVGTQIGTYGTTDLNPACTPPSGFPYPTCSIPAGTPVTQVGNSGFTGTASPFAEVFYPFWGTITFAVQNPGGEYLQVTPVGCNSDWVISINSSLTGGTITIPSTDPATYNNQGEGNGCELLFGTIPPGVSTTPPFLSYYEYFTINPVGGA
jgi:hypothetical protein